MMQVERNPMARYLEFFGGQTEALKEKLFTQFFGTHNPKTDADRCVLVDLGDLRLMIHKAAEFGLEYGLAIEDSDETILR